MRRALFVFALVASLVVARSAGAGPRHDALDTEVLDAMAQQAPQALDVYLRGEELAANGSLDQAVALFRQANAAFHDSHGMIMRRECEALTALNRRSEAISVCWHALQEGHMLTTVAATVRALVSGPISPTFLDVANALDLIARDRRRAPHTAELTGAMCEVAESIGDGVMLQHCVNELEHIAPQYAATFRARRALDAQCPPWRFWGGWLAIMAAVLATGIDALRRRTAHVTSPTRSAGMMAAVIAAAVLAFPSAARADGEKWLSTWHIDDANPEASVPDQKDLAADPLQAGYFLQDLVSKANLASKRGEHRAAVRFYQAMLKAVPKRAISMTKMCDEFEAMGDYNNAINSCGLALMLEGLTVDDYIHYVRLMLEKPGTLNGKEVKAVSNVIAHMKQEDAGRTVGNQLECQLAVKIDDAQRLEACSSALAATAPDDPSTISFQWSLALMHKHYRDAQKLVDRAKEVGANADVVRRMQDLTLAGASQWRRSVAVSATGLMLLFGALGYGGMLLMRRRAGRERAEPAAA